MPRSPERSADGNLLFAIIGLTLTAGTVAVLVGWVCGYVLDSFQSSATMALLITDAGVKSDDANLERQLSTATAALVACRDFAFALGIGCLGVGGAVVVRASRS